MIELTDQPIDIAQVLAAVTDPTCGAEVLFIGTTRQWTLAASSAGQPLASPPRETSHLIYDCYHEMALAQMQRLVEMATARWPVKKVAMVHRLGRVDPTEASVALAVSCPHRSEAFEAAQWLIDELKHHVPIWKQEHYVQSEAEWIHPTDGNCRCSTGDSTALTNRQSSAMQVTERSHPSTSFLHEKQLQQQSQQQ